MAKPLGKVTHFYDKISVAVITVAKGFSNGDSIHIGKGPYLKQKAVSMQNWHKPVEKCRKGQEIGLKVKERVRVGDMVFKCMK
jgi:hypothetical protein